MGVNILRQRRPPEATLPDPPRKNIKPILPVEQRRHLHGKIAFAIQYGLAEVPIGIEALKSADRYIQDLEAQCAALRDAILALREKTGKSAGVDLCDRIEAALSGEAGADVSARLVLYEKVLAGIAGSLPGTPEGTAARESLEAQHNGKAEEPR